MSKPRPRAAGSPRAVSLKLAPIAALVIALTCLPGLSDLAGRSGHAHAAPLIVTSVADDGAPGTLRSRIEEANADDESNIIDFTVPSGSEILFLLDLEDGRPLPVEVTSDITLREFPKRVSVGAGPGGISENAGIVFLSVLRKVD
jgi:hypothetical protein